VLDPLNRCRVPPATCPLLCYLLFCRRTTCQRSAGGDVVYSPCANLEASPNDASGAIDDSADNPTGDSTNSDNAVRSNRDIRSNSPDNNQGSNRPVNLRKPQSGHLLLQVVE